jgi:hypothetical protein
MAKIGNEAKLVLKLFEERIRTANGEDGRQAEHASEPAKTSLKAQIHGREHALAMLKSIHLELMEE